jgi:hypothetical protein
MQEKLTPIPAPPEEAINEKPIPAPPEEAINEKPIPAPPEEAINEKPIPAPLEDAIRREINRDAWVHELEERLRALEVKVSYFVQEQRHQVIRKQPYYPLRAILGDEKYNAISTDPKMHTIAITHHDECIRDIERALLAMGHALQAFADGNHKMKTQKVKDRF